MKLALCLKSLEDISQLFNNQVETIELTMVDREICEVDGNGWTQLIPTATFVTDTPDGRLHILQYQRAVKKADGEEVNEQRLAGKTSVLFGGHIDQVEDLVFETAGENEHGQQVFTMTAEQLMATINNVIRREVSEELGIDITDYELQATGDNVVVFQGNPEIEVNRVHLCMGAIFHLPVEELSEIREKAVIAKDEIAELGYLVVNFGAMLADFNIGVSIESLGKQLVEEHNMEDWASIMVGAITSSVCGNFVQALGWEDIQGALNNRIAREQFEKEQQEAIEAQESAEEQVVSE